MSWGRGAASDSTYRDAGPTLWRWVTGRGGKGAVCSLNVALSTWFCPFAQLCGASCSHTSEEIVGITVCMLGGLY